VSSSSRASSSLQLVSEISDAAPAVFLRPIMDVKAYVLLFSAVVLVAAQDGSSQNSALWDPIIKPGDEINYANDTSCYKACNLRYDANTEGLQDCLGLCAIPRMTKKSCYIRFQTDETKRQFCLALAEDSDIVRCHNSCNLSYSKKRLICQDGKDVTHDFRSSLCYGVIQKCHYEEYGNRDIEKICDDRWQACSDHVTEHNVHDCAGAKAYCIEDCYAAWYKKAFSSG